MKTGRIFVVFAILAIFIACLGLLGLVSFTSAVRTREIGIRRVLGASISSITSMIYRDFAKLLFIASAIAFPAGYYICTRWLEDFAYRINLDAWMFALTFISIFVFSLFVISIQTVKAARLNPVDTLRDE